MAFQNCKLEKDANELSDSFLNIEFLNPPLHKRI